MSKEKIINPTTMTIRLKEVSSERFKKLCKVSKKTQGAMLSYLLNVYNSGKKGIIEGIEKSDSHITLLLRYYDPKCNKILESKKYVLEGEVLYESSENKIYGKYIKEEWKDKINNEFNYMSYKFKLIKEKNKDRFIVHQNFYIGDKYRCIFNIMNVKFASDLCEVKSIIEEFTKEKDIDNVELLISEEITSEEELLDYFK